MKLDLEIHKFRLLMKKKLERWEKRKERERQKYIVKNIKFLFSWNLKFYNFRRSKQFYKLMKFRIFF